MKTVSTMKTNISVETRSDAAKDDLSGGDVGERHQAADRRERVVPGVDSAAGGVGRDRSEEGGLTDAEPDLFPFHVAAGATGGRRRNLYARLLMNRIASLLGNRGDRSADEEHQRHRREDRPAVLLRTGHAA